MVQEDLSINRLYYVVEREDTDGTRTHPHARSGVRWLRYVATASLICVPPLYLNATMSETIQIRQQNPDEEENMAKLDSESDVYGYLSRHLADQLGEYIAVTLSEDDGTEVPADGVTGSGSGNYVTFETAGGNIVGFGVHLSILEDVLGFSVERDEDGNVTNAPESVNMAFSPSTEDDYEEAASADEDEAEALIAGGDDSDEEETDGEAEAEELVEIDDEELDLEA